MTTVIGMTCVSMASCLSSSIRSRDRRRQVSAWERGTAVTLTLCSVAKGGSRLPWASVCVDGNGLVFVARVVGRVRGIGRVSGAPPASGEVKAVCVDALWEIRFMTNGESSAESAHFLH